MESNMVINTQKQKAFILFDLVIPILELFPNMKKREQEQIECVIMFTAANTGRNLKCPKMKEPVDMSTLWKITMLLENIIMKTILYKKG